MISGFWFEGRPSSYMSSTLMPVVTVPRSRALASK